MNHRRTRIATCSLVAIGCYCCCCCCWVTVTVTVGERVPPIAVKTPHT